MKFIPIFKNFIILVTKIVFLIHFELFFYRTWESDPNLFFHVHGYANNKLPIVHHLGISFPCFWRIVLWSIEFFFSPVIRSACHYTPFDLLGFWWFHYVEVVFPSCFKGLFWDVVIPSAPHPLGRYHLT